MKDLFELIYFSFMFMIVLLAGFIPAAGILILFYKVLELHIVVAYLLTLVFIPVIVAVVVKIEKKINFLP